MTNEQQQALIAERDALSAQIKLVRNIFRDDSLSEKETLRKLVFIIDATPADCLAQVKADAGRDGFVAGAKVYGFNLEYVQQNADEYAESIRQSSTGTWLKDSNVNGGKREGGE